MAVRFESVTPHLHVADVVRTAQYYARMFGFEVEGYWDGQRVHHDAEGLVVFGILKRDGIRLHVNRVGAPLHGAGVEGGYHMYFDVEGIDELAADLRRRGADIIEGPTDRSYGAREVVVRDCNGLILAFGAT